MKGVLDEVAQPVDDLVMDYSPSDQFTIHLAVNGTGPLPFYFLKDLLH